MRFSSQKVSPKEPLTLNGSNLWLLANFSGPTILSLRGSQNGTLFLKRSQIVHGPESRSAKINVDLKFTVSCYLSTKNKDVWRLHNCLVVFSRSRSYKWNRQFHVKGCMNSSSSPETILLGTMMYSIDTSLDMFTQIYFVLMLMIINRR